MSADASPYPREFFAFGKYIGIKAAGRGPDFGVIHSKRPCTSAALFTQNMYPGQPVIVGREHAAAGRLQTIMVNSGNSNVATGPAGLEIARRSCEEAARALGLDAQAILPSSTGVIGRPLPAEKLQGACADIPANLRALDSSQSELPPFEEFAEAIRTTDAYRKTGHLELRSGARLAGAAKGAGMIMPDMATMLTYFITDAEIDAADLRRLFHAIMQRTFNRISVDGDTSTSDTAAMLANGASGVRIRFPEAAARALANLPVHVDDLSGLADVDGFSEQDREFARALLDLARRLALMIVRDGEGAKRIFSVRVIEAADPGQALRVARRIANSPLVKTAIHGADPNWGRLVMAVGKEPERPALAIEKLRIYFGERSLHDAVGDAALLRDLSQYIQDADIVEMTVALGAGEAADCVWASDLSQAYVHLNSEYTT